MELTSNQTYQIMQRMPTFNPSYETNAPEMIDAEYNTGVAIPLGKKVYLWFTFHQDKDVCYMIDINRNKKLSTARLLCNHNCLSLSIGTILYGTLVEPEPDTTGQTYVVVEDIHYYKGFPMKQTNWGNKIKCIYDVIQTTLADSSYNAPRICFPVMWDRDITLNSACIPDRYLPTLGYQCHHVQYRTVDCIRPYLNASPARRSVPRDDRPANVPVMPKNVYISQHTPDFSKPQYKYPTTFEVRADTQFDIYHLFAYGKSNTSVYYGVACVPDYKTSVFLNGLFRNIRENRNLDYIEESDDEDDFQNVDSTKYVDLNRVCFMECTFHRKFKRWVPTRIADRQAKIVHISRVVNDRPSSYSK